MVTLIHRKGKAAVALMLGVWLGLNQVQASNKITADGVDFASVKSAVAKAHDGDTVIIPVGTATWTKTLTVSKNISLVGAGIDQTIFVDQTPKGKNQNPLFQIEPKSKTILLRISGFTINGSTGGPTGNTIDKGSLAAISIAAISATPNVRVDHIKFYQLYQRPLVFFGGAWGVIDHCEFTMEAWTGGINIRHDAWKGSGKYGDNSWADDPHWGSEQAIFIEDCSFNNFSSATFIDGDGGMRVVIRHNKIYGSEAGNHGTETGQRFRSGRTLEFYQNQCDGGPSTFKHNWMLYLRGGSALVWGNQSDRYDSLVVMSEYRLWFPATPWGQADGTNPWDVNSPAVYATGTHKGENGSSTLVDSAANWQPNQWRGYSIRNITQNTASSVNTNTSNSIKPDGNPQGQAMSFKTGDQYDIRKVETVLDQPGRGKGDLISGVKPTPVQWPHQQQEPIRIWGNTLGPSFGNQNGKPTVYSQGYTVLENRDWFYSKDNFGALPGYVPYTYPHPLVGSEPSTPGNSADRR
jgi:hypothetical protein